MKKRSKHPSLKNNLYTGICKKCGEAYEAESGADDLEGVSFRCKKFLCSGKVSLQMNESDSLEEISPIGGFHIPQGPKKFC